MIAYKTGERFPHSKYLNRGEICCAMPAGDFFDVLCCISSPTSEEIKQFKNGKLTVYLFEQSNIPFLVFDMGFNFDISIDATKVVKEKPDWMQQKANVVNMYLVDARTGILKAMRMISFPDNFVYKIRDVVTEQLKMNNVNIEVEISKILNRYATEMMMRKAQMQISFQGS